MSVTEQTASLDILTGQMLTIMSTIYFAMTSRTESVDDLTVGSFMRLRLRRTRTGRLAGSLQRCLVGLEQKQALGMEITCQGHLTLLVEIQVSQSARTFLRGTAIGQEDASLDIQRHPIEVVQTMMT